LESEAKMEFNELNFEIKDEDALQRVDQYLSGQLSDYSRSFLNRLVKEQNVLVDGKCVKPSYQVHGGENVKITLPAKKNTKPQPEDIPLDILFEDRDVIVVNKPKGMVVHPAPGNYSHTLVNALLFHCGDQLATNDEMRPGIVHRIDKDTTGALVICKNDTAFASLSAQLAAHTITRRYRAICCGELTEEGGTIEGNIGRNPHDRLKMASGLPQGKPAVTHYRVLERFHGYSYIECRLETGRTHQIRVHMASIHHPILGDEVYGPKKNMFKHLQGQTLHAMILGFHHPLSGEYMEFTAPLPEYFTDLLKKMKNVL